MCRRRIGGRRTTSQAAYFFVEEEAIKAYKEAKLHAFYMEELISNPISEPENIKDLEEALEEMKEYAEDIKRGIRRLLN